MWPTFDTFFCPTLSDAEGSIAPLDLRPGVYEAYMKTLYTLVKDRLAAIYGYWSHEGLSHYGLYDTVVARE